MTEKAPFYTTISISSSDRDELKKTCKNLNITQQDFIPLALRFFKKTGLDIHHYEEIMNVQIKKSENRLIGFLKTQDQEMKNQELRLKNEMEVIQRNQLAIVEHLKALIKNINADN